MASKSKIRRRVLGASCILAALIVAGSSFAWFTSKDEVTNRLTATADYGVSIVEDFTPPKDITPGQQVNKDVSVVNTGSVDALVRLSIEDYINMSKLGSTELTTTLSTTTADTQSYFMTANGTVANHNASSVNTVTNEVTAPAPEAGETFLYNLRKFTNTYTTPSGTTALVELNAMEKLNGDGTRTANEVTTLMAGGRVMVAESTAVAPDKQAVRSGDDVNGDVNGFAVIYKYTNSSDTTNDGKLFVPSGTNQYAEVTLNSNGLYEKTGTDTSLDADKLSIAELARDYSGAGQYTPQNTGLFLFERTGTNNLVQNTVGVTNPTYSGFYYDNNAKKFYALKTQTATGEAPTTAGNNSTAVIAFGTGGGVVTEDTADGTGKVVKSIGGVELLTKTTGITNSASTGWTFAFYKDNKTEIQTGDAINTADTKYIKATFNPDVTNDDVIFWIELDSTWTSNWKYVQGTKVNEGYSAVSGDNGNLGYFYYTKKLDSGATSNKLVDSVTLDSAMTTANYLDLTYDLNVVLDSVQVTKDQYGHETAEAVISSGDNAWATPTLTKTNGVITSISWS